MSTATLKPGHMIVRNTDSQMAGQSVSRNGKTYTLDNNGRAVVPEDCGIHLCGPEWVVEAGEPRVQVSQAGGTVIRPADGPLSIWKCPADYNGERITARDHSIIQFSSQGYGLGVSTCGLEAAGYTLVGAATQELIDRHGLAAPVTVAALEQERLAAMLAANGVGEEIEDDDDPYEQLARELAKKKVVPTKKSDLAAISDMPASAIFDAQDDILPPVPQPVKPEPAQKEAEELPAPTLDQIRVELQGTRRPRLNEIALEMGIEKPENLKVYNTNKKLVDAILKVAAEQLGEVEDTLDQTLGAPTWEKDTVNDIDAKKAAVAAAAAE